MKRYTTLLSLLFASLCYSGTSIAENFTVYIGSYVEPDLQAMATAQRYGDLYQIADDEKLLRINVGQYDNKDEAEDVLFDLQAAGFSDALVTTLAKNAKIMEVDSSVLVDASYNSKALPTAKEALPTGYEELTADEQEKAVTLDGKLRIKVGDKFLTLDQYRTR